MPQAASSRDLAPLTPATVASGLKHLREPALNLDSVCEDGPTFDPSSPTAAGDFYDGINLKIGTAATKQNDNTDMPGVRVPPEDDLNRDLPRVDKIAQMYQGRPDCDSVPFEGARGCRGHAHGAFRRTQPV